MKETKEMPSGLKGISRGPRLEPTPEVDQLAHDVIGAAIEVHRALGPGYLESIYEQALRVEFGVRSIPFEEQAAVTVEYKGRKIGEAWIDFLVRGCLWSLRQWSPSRPFTKLN